MSQTYYYANGVRVANFSKINLPTQYLLNFNSESSTFILKEIRKYADLPYIFVVSKEQTENVVEVLSNLKEMRSRCYPYAVFTIDNAHLGIESEPIDIIKVDDADGKTLYKRITEYAEAKFHFDDEKLKHGSIASPPVKTDVVIVGAGIIGLYAANRLKQKGISFCIFDKREKIGGIWSMYANTTSRVNTSEGAYRLVEKKIRSNRDHSATREVLEDIAEISDQISENLFLNTEVQKIEKSDSGYRVSFHFDGLTSIIESKGVILAINDRVGPPREIKWPNQERFQGEIVTGISDNALKMDWYGKNVAVVGMGAFAIENARTALEGGARHVTVVCRRHGTICPKIIDYLNFATPYDDDFKHDKKSNIRNMMYWKKLYDLSGATQPECWMGKIKHPGHTISVSDIWFIAHFLKKITTVTGEITDLSESEVIINDQHRISADIVVNCIGFERNASAAKAISGYTETYNTNYLDKDFIYLADAYIDDDAFNSFFGSSVLEMAKFYTEVYIKFFNSPQYDEMTQLEDIKKIPIEARSWSQYIMGAEALIRIDPELKQAARKQVDQRTRNFVEQHDLETYIAENKREWMDLHSLLAGRSMPEAECLPYVFEKLLPKTN